MREAAHAPVNTEAIRIMDLLQSRGVSLKRSGAQLTP